MKVGNYKFVWRPSDGSDGEKTEYTNWEKWRALLLMLAITFFMGMWAGSARAACPDHLKWQRWEYTKAHYNITQSLQGHAPKKIKWSHPSSRASCMKALSTAKKLRKSEAAHWKRVYHTQAGVKWIIRKTFAPAGPDAVKRAHDVVSCESSFIWNRRSHTGDVGPWQINHVHGLPDSFTTDPVKSTEWSYRASDHGKNFSPTWVCATRLGIA